MAELKNVNRLTGIPLCDIEKMELAACEHARFNSIKFKVESYDDRSVVFNISQGKNSAGAYHNKSRLIQIVHETFDRFFPGRKVLVHAFPYIDAPVNKVTDEWIRKQMHAKGIKLKDIEHDTGMNYAYLSSLTNGNEPLSQGMKSMFYYYFLSKS